MTIEERCAGREVTTGGGDGIIFIPQSTPAGEDVLGEPLLPLKEEKGSVAVVLLSVGIAVWGAFAFGTCAGFSAPSQLGMMEDLGLSLSQFSTFGSILSIGAMFGATTSGYIADFVGRKGVPVYVAEISPKDLRGGLTTLNQFMVAVGASTVFICAAFVKWNSLVLVGALPCLALLIGSIFISESPRWLAKVGDQERFIASLQVLRGKEANVDVEATQIKDNINETTSLPKTTLKDVLFGKRYIHSLMVPVGLMIFQQFIGVGGIGCYASKMFVDAGFESGDIGTAIMGSIQIPITLVGAFLMDRTGRKPLLILSASGTLIGMLVTALSFLVKEQGLHSHWIPIIALGGVLFFSGSFAIGMAAIPWVIMSEVFPLNIKGIGGSIVTFVSWFGSWATSYSFNFLMTWTASGTLFMYTTICAASIMFIAKVVPETKGKTLEEIQASLNY